MNDQENNAAASEELRLQLDHLGQELIVPPGKRIVGEGEAPDFFYVIHSGRVEVFRETKNRTRIELNVMGPGAYFGEMALVTGQPRLASVEALEECVLTRISKAEFDALLDRNPQLSRRIVWQLAQWLEKSYELVIKEEEHEEELRQISWFDYLLMVGLSLVFALVVNHYNVNGILPIHGWGEKDVIPEITLSQALELYQKNQALVVDAREKGFYSQGHIKGAQNIPVKTIDLLPMFLKWAHTEEAKDKTIIVYGGTFSRRMDVDLARLLKGKGLGNVVVLKDYGGWPEVFKPLEVFASTKESMKLGLPGYLEWLPVSIFLFILIPPIWRSPYLSVACRLLLGMIFILFSLSKIMSPAVFAWNVVDYGLMPSYGVNLWALALPWAELIVGLFMILGIRTRAAATLIAAMNVIFIVGLVNAILHHMPINCGCVGEVGEPVDWLKVLKNAGMLVMCLQIFLYDQFLVLDRGGFILRGKKL
jgi:putative oxidoreductase